MGKKLSGENLESSLPLPDTTPSARTPLVDLPDDDEKELSEVELLESSFDQKLSEWVQLNCTEDIVPLVYLYKFDHPTNGEAKSLICKYDNEIPDAHTVGLQFGSGRYWISVIIPKKANAKSSLIRGYRFRIHAEYDRLKSLQQSGVSSGTPSKIIVQQPVMDQRSTMNEGLSMVKEVMALLIPLLAINRQSESSNMPDMAKFMMSQYSQMGEIMKHNILESGKLLADGQRMKIEAQTFEGVTTEDTEDNSKSIIEQIVPYIGQFLPMLLGSGPQATATAKAVQMLPQFAQVKNNPAELKTLVSYLDKTKGQEVTNKLLARLKIKRP